jgi:hypothetical protein
VNHYLVLERPALISPELLIARLHLLIFLLIHLHILDQFELLGRLLESEIRDVVLMQVGGKPLFFIP